AAVAARRRRTPRELRQGTSPDILQLDPRKAIRVDPETGRIPPWKAYSTRERREMVCHPIAINLAQCDRELFLSYFNGRILDSHAIKEFLRNFPKFPTNLATSDFKDHILPYLDELTQCSLLHNIYVPPPQTYSIGDPLGSYFNSMPVKVQEDALYKGGPALLQALKHEYTGLRKYPEISDEILRETDGYKALMNLAHLGAHPRLLGETTPEKPPKQGNKDSFPAFYGKLVRYAKRLFYFSQVMSDRYFLELLYAGAHPSIRTWITQTLRMELQMAPRDKPLGATLTPDYLLQTIRTEAARDSMMTKLSKAPMETAASARAQQVLGNRTFEAEDDSVPGGEDTDNTMSFTEYTDRIIAAISNDKAPDSRACFLCKGKHLVEECPIVAWLRTNDFARRLVLRALSNKTDNAENRGKKEHIRMLLGPSEDEDDPGPPTLEGGSRSSSSDSDFRQAG
ncbi:MAG: hypothetical protein ACO37D_10545, partial [Rhodothermales bacterium]